MSKASEVRRIEQIVKVICVFIITLLLTSSIFFSIFIGDPHTIVIWFGFINIQLFIYHLVSFSTSFGLCLIFARISYIQWQRDSLQFNGFQLLLYGLVIILGILIVITSHGFYLPFIGSMMWLFLDIGLIIQAGVISVIVGLAIWKARTPDQLAEEKYKLQQLMNEVADGLYEIEKEEAGSFKRFFLKYIAHHFWIGILLLGMGAATQIVNPYFNHGTALMWFIIGGFLVADDTINHLFHISFTSLFPKRLKNEQAYDRVGKVFTVIFIVAFLIICVCAIYGHLYLYTDIFG